VSPIFGETYKRAEQTNSKEEFIKSREAANAATAWGTTLLGSGLQSYGISALLLSAGAVTYKGAAIVGSLVFLATSAPTVSSQVSE